MSAMPVPLTRRRRQSRAISLSATVVALVIAASAVLGWVLDVPLLKSGVAGFIAMNPITAIAFLFAASALLAIHNRRALVPGSPIAARILAAMVVLLPLLCTSRLFTPWDLGPDRLLFAASAAVPLQGYANRMAPLTAINFVLVGMALILLTLRPRRAAQVALSLATVAGATALIVVIDYCYSSSLAVVQGLIPVALNTAVAFIALTVAVLCIRPADGVAALFFSDQIGGLLARRMLPAAVLIPLLIGWAELQAEQGGWISRTQGSALVATCTTLLLAGLVWFSGRSLDRGDRARHQAERELRDFNLRLETRVGERTAELRETEEQVRHTADQLRGWFDASPVASCSVTLDNRVLSWNPAAERLFGWKAEEIVGRELPVIPTNRAEEMRGLRARVVAGKPITDHETQRQCKDGRLVDVSVTTAPLHDAAGTINGVVVVYVDISERKRLEAQLRQSQKMEAVGRLAGGVAHDFNNILMVIQASAGFLLGDLDDDDARRTDAIEIADAATRAANLTRQLLAFSRQQVLRLQVLDINAVVKPLEPMLRRLVEGNIEILLRLGSDMDSIQADPTQLDQVLLNLVVNARDAMPRGGTILIETSNVVLDNEYPRTHMTANPGPHVLLTVTDTGEGMDTETQARLFEPFFSTKPVGQGTGLGLATVYGIIKQLGGHIWVYSELGRGTTFKIYLPIATDGVAVVAPRRDEPVDLQKRQGRILLVEDDASVRASILRLLERQGYQVREASNGAEALAMFGDTENTVDLVLSDMVMPGISGPELRRRIGELPGAPPVLLMSGYSHEAITRFGGPEWVGTVIEKPFTAERIVSKIDEALESVAAR